jgi:hypothetical protein
MRALVTAPLILIALLASSTLAAERELGKVKSKALAEVSGMAASRANDGVLWVSNDGDSGRVYAIRTGGKLIAELRLPVRVLDVEELTLGPGPAHGADYLYVGDIGDNDSRRFEVTVVRLREPVVDSTLEEKVEQAEQFRLAYPDGPHDAEAMFVDPESKTLFIVTKESQGGRLYCVALDALKDRVQSKLKLLGRVRADSVSGAAISPDGRRIVLRREEHGWLWNRQPGASVAEALQGAPQVVTVRGRRQGKNGEAVAFRGDSRGYLTLSEGKKQAISEFDLPALEAASEGSGSK